MPNYIEYRKSISLELMSIKDRVRNFVSHWSEDGRYKEVILKNVLEKHLPKTVSVGTGFVVGDDTVVSSQIDIIIYSNDYPPLFHMGDFVIVVKECVLGIIEVKSKIENGCKFREMIQKAHENGELIGAHIFNGVFGYEADVTVDSDSLPESVRSYLVEYSGYINNIAFGHNLFIKYWEAGMPSNSNFRTAPDVPHYSFYKLENLSFGYFISNLIEDVYTNLHGSTIPTNLSNALYPIEQTKEASRIDRYEIELR
jgi:hypothetical protein